MNHFKSIISASFLLVAVIGATCTLASSSNNSPELTIISQDAYPNDHSQQLLASGQQQQSAVSFDASNYKNVHEAISAHPNLAEFAKLCEADGVKEIISLDKTPLTVFAPIDRSLSDLLAKSRSSRGSSMSLIELAKHHIAQGLIAPDENTKYPFQFGTYSNLSPLYLTQSRVGGASQQQQQQAVFVNNAKILATYLIPIDANSESYQTLHVIDSVIEFAYVNRKAQLRAAGGANSRPTAHTKKSAFNLDDFFANGQEASQAAAEFYQRFGDVQANQPSVDLYHARAFKGSAQRLSLSRDELNLEKLSRAFRHFQQLRGRLFQVNESTSFNTYFLPINSNELEAVLKGANPLAYEAFVVPDQVLFTRTMGLRRSYESLLSRDAAGSGHKLSLSLAKSMPIWGPDETEAAAAADGSSLSRKLLATPLLLQAKCEPQQPNGDANFPFRAGITNAELVLANIPLSNGVLHFIRKPILVTGDSNLLDYINDDEDTLSNVVNALGSRTITKFGDALNQEPQLLGEANAIKVSKFRDLLAREREILSTLSMARGMNKTILAPSDEAFAKLKYSLRGLVSGDESLIPKHWDLAHRQELLERLVRRHVVLHQTITSDQISEQLGGLRVLSENRNELSFSQLREPESQASDFVVDSDSTRASLLHHDLIGSNGVLHIIDRVLGEEQETIHSLLESIVLKYKHALEDSGANPNELHQLVQANLRQQQGAPDYNNQISAASSGGEQEPSNANNPELSIISKSIGQYLEEIAQSNRRQYQLLASSVNISYQLAKLTSQAEGLEDWNDKFKREDGAYTYFVPSDLAWLRLQQLQPELYKPLMHFLEQSAADSAPTLIALDAQLEGGRAGKPLRSSQSSHRLHKILERHLVNRKITKKDLNQLDSLQTLGATLRLLEPASNQQQQQHLTEGNQASTSAALHSILSAGTNQQQQGATSGESQQLRLKALKLAANPANTFANIVQANETSNGFVYIIDNVLLMPEDSDYIQQTQQSPAISSSMSSLLGAHNSAILDFIQSLLAPSPFNMSASSILALCATLILAIAVLLILALVLLVRKGRQNKSNRHQQLESGLTSSSSANSGSTSTTKSL